MGEDLLRRDLRWSPTTSEEKRKKEREKRETGAKEVFTGFD